MGDTHFVQFFIFTSHTLWMSIFGRFCGFICRFAAIVDVIFLEFLCVAIGVRRVMIVIIGGELE
jgi:hypothetical protein